MIKSPDTHYAAVPSDYDAESATHSTNVSQIVVALLLEDEPLISMDLEHTFESEGFTVSIVTSCKDAHSWLDRHSPDIVLVDIELSDGRCTDVVQRLVEAHIPFIVHSGDPPANHAGTPFAQGVWVSKPADWGELIGAARVARTKIGLRGSRVAPPEL